MKINIGKIYSRLPAFAKRPGQYKKQWLAIVAAVIALWAIIFFLKPPQEAQAAWWNDGWMYRKKVEITNSSDSNLTDFQVAITLDTASLISTGKMQSNCNDIRITDANGKVLPHWVEDRGPYACNDSDSKIWTKVPHIPTSGATIYVYYGNPSALNQENPGDVFEFFDDFNDGDSNGWSFVDSSAWSVVDGELRQNPTSDNKFAYNPSINMQDLVLEFNFRKPTGYMWGTAHVRMPDASNTTTTRTAWQKSTGSLNIVERINSTNYTRASGTASFGTFGSGNYRFSIKVGGSYMGVYINDNLEISTNDLTRITSGFIGLHGSYDPWDYVYFDNVFIRKYASSDPSTSSGSEEKSPGPVAYWKFDEGYGTTANDSTSNQNNGILGTGSSAPEWQPEDMCISGKCLKFDGNNDYVSAANTISDIKTVSFWVKPNTTTEYFIDLNGSAYISASSGTISATGFTSPTIYVDGKQSTTLTANKWQYITVTTNTALSGTAIKLGQIGTNFLQGFLDEVKIYPYARSAAQVKTDYLAGLAGAGTAKGAAAVLGSSKERAGGVNLSDGLVGYWKMDEDSWDGTADEVIDSSGNSNHGVAVGATPPTTGAGKFGNGGSFDGSDDYIRSSSNNGLPTQLPVTISFWAKPTSTSLSGAFDTYPANISAFRIFDAEGGIQLRSLGCGGGMPYQSYITANTFQHITIIAKRIENTTLLEMYVNGTFKTSKSYSSVASIGFNNLTFGTINTSQTPYSGILDEIRIYNRALSPAEVRALYEWAPGPVAYWKLDEKTGTTVYDASGNSNNGSLGTGSSAPSWANGKFGGALNFDGNNDYIEINSQLLNIGSLGNSGFTISAWHKKNTTNQGIIDITGDYDGNYWWLIWFSSNTTINFGVDDGSNNPKASATVTDDTNWHYVTGVWDANNNTAYLYWDGILVASTNTASFNPANSTSPVRIGVGGSGRTTQFFNGLIDDVRIYNYSRTQKQIVEDMNAGHPVGGSPVGSQVGYWKFDEGYGSTAYDSSPQENNGILGSGDSAPSWSNDGKFGKALSFTRSENDYVETNFSSIDPSTDAFTVTAWIYPTDLTADNQVIIQQQNGTGTGRTWIAINAATCGGDKVYSYLGGSCTTGTTSPVANNWYYVAVTSDTTTVKIYVNGKLENSSTPTIESANGSVLIGNGKNFNLGFNGIIDEVKIYNYALTENEIKLDYNQGKTIVMGTTSTESDGSTPSFSSSREYCVPGDTSYCAPPVAEWKFDEKTGTTAYDTSGNGNNGTLTNMEISDWTTGKYGSALKFDGSNEFVLGNNDSELQISQGTVEAWIKTSSPGASYRGIVVKQNAYGMFLKDNEFGVYDWTSASWRGSGTNLNDGNWHHVVFTFNSGVSNGTKLYIDGQHKLDTTITISAQTESLVAASGSDTGSQFFNGKIDQVRIYDYARTPAQIAWDYNRGKPVAWWKFDECQGTIAYDSSGNGNNGTINIGATAPQTSVGTCTSGNSTDAWYNGATGKFNSSLNFDGADDYVSIGDLSSIDFTNYISISLWQYGNNSQPQNDFIFNGVDSSNYRVISAHIPWGNSSVYWDAGNSGTSFYDRILKLADSSEFKGKWNHWVFTKDAVAGIMKIYLNGKLWHSGSGKNRTLSPITNFKIGAKYSGENSYGGQIDDVRIYNYALTAEQVKNLYNEGAAVRFGN